MAGPSGLVILKGPGTWADAVLGPSDQNCCAVGPNSLRQLAVGLWCVQL